MLIFVSISKGFVLVYFINKHPTVTFANYAFILQFNEVSSIIDAGAVYSNIPDNLVRLRYAGTSVADPY